MPELPEVETIRKDLQKELVGLKILGFRSDWSKKIFPSEKELKDKVIGTTINSVERKAKLLIFHLSNGYKLIFHLKISGQLLIRKQGDVEDKYTHHVFKLSKGKELRFADLRKFGFIKVMSETQKDEELSKFGPEPLSADLNAKLFYKLVKDRKKPIKLLLLDQGIIAGVGNIYANEALFLAHLHPERKAARLSKQEAYKLYEKIEQVLKEGLYYRGASDSNYIDAYGKAGHYQEHFKVYGRRGEPCVNCNTPLTYKKIRGRGTVFCSKCQI